MKRSVRMQFLVQDGKIVFEHRREKGGTDHGGYGWWNEAGMQVAGWWCCTAEWKDEDEVLCSVE